MTPSGLSAAAGSACEMEVAQGGVWGGRKGGLEYGMEGGMTTTMRTTGEGRVPPLAQSQYLTGH